MAQRIYLRMVEIEDAELLEKWIRDKENLKFMSTRMRCMEHTKESIEKEIREMDKDYERWFMVCLKDSGKAIGHAGIDDLDIYDRRGEIFFLIGEKSEQGKGYGKEIVFELLEYGFNEMKLHSFFATVAVDNKSSLKVLKNAGFKEIGVRRDYNFIDGKFVDEILLDILDSDYAKRPKQE